MLLDRSIKVTNLKLTQDDRILITEDIPEDVIIQDNISKNSILTDTKSIVIPKHKIYR